jgi:hypothetical protein
MSSVKIVDRLNILPLVAKNVYWVEFAHKYWHCLLAMRPISSEIICTHMSNIYWNFNNFPIRSIVTVTDRVSGCVHYRYVSPCIDQLCVVGDDN